MGITITKDEADKLRDAPLSTPDRPGFVRRWVRVKGYDAEGHMGRMQEAGYVPVERTPETETAGKDVRLKSGQHSQLDTTIKRGDTMLMECPEERVQARRDRQQTITKARTDGVTKRMQAEIARVERSRKE